MEYVTHTRIKRDRTQFRWATRDSLTAYSFLSSRSAAFFNFKYQSYQFPFGFFGTEIARVKKQAHTPAYVAN